jgi:hypothetical protein
MSYRILIKYGLAVAGLLVNVPLFLIGATLFLFGSQADTSPKEQREALLVGSVLSMTSCLSIICLVAPRKQGLLRICCYLLQFVIILYSLGVARIRPVPTRCEAAYLAATACITIVVMLIQHCFRPGNQKTGGEQLGPTDRDQTTGSTGRDGASPTS